MRAAGVPAEAAQQAVSENFGLEQDTRGVLRRVEESIRGWSKNGGRGAEVQTNMVWLDLRTGESLGRCVQPTGGEGRHQTLPSRSWPSTTQARRLRWTD